MYMCFRRIKNILQIKSLRFALFVICFSFGMADSYSLIRKARGSQGNIPMEEFDDSDEAENLPSYEWTTPRADVVTEVYLNLEIGKIESKPVRLHEKMRKVRPKNEESRAKHRRQKFYLSEIVNWSTPTYESEDKDGSNDATGLARKRNGLKELPVHPENHFARPKGEKLMSMHHRQPNIVLSGVENWPNSYDEKGKQSGRDIPVIMSRSRPRSEQDLEKPGENLSFRQRERKPSRHKAAPHAETPPAADELGLNELSPEEYDNMAKTVGDEAKKWAKAENLPLSVLTDTPEEDFCQNGGTCYKLENGDLKCSCPRNFTGDRCEILDECLTAPCGEHQLCENVGGSFRCICTPGFVLLGHDCIPAMTCAELPCRNHGECEDLPHGNVHCICRLGYTGSRCQKKVRECDVSSCAPDETCVSLPEGFQCFKQ